MSERLADVLADAKSDADQLQCLGYDRDANLLRTFIKRVELSAHAWLNYLSETDAALFSGVRPRVLRRRFAAWEARGVAFKKGRTRFYCEAILPRRAELRAARDAGRAAAQEHAAEDCT
ncbi:MAG: hypothetical protein ACYC6C_14550 [Coriobacteriia bacterium]